MPNILLHTRSWDNPRDTELDADQAAVLLEETLAGSENHTLERLVHFVTSLDLHVLNWDMSVDGYVIVASNLTSEAEWPILGVWVAHDERHDGFVQWGETVEDEADGAALGVSGDCLDSETAHGSCQHRCGTSRCRC